MSNTTFINYFTIFLQTIDVLFFFFFLLKCDRSSNKFLLVLIQAYHYHHIFTYNNYLKNAKATSVVCKNIVKLFASIALLNSYSLISVIFSKIKIFINRIMLEIQTFQMHITINYNNNKKPYHNLFFKSPFFQNN